MEKQILTEFYLSLGRENSMWHDFHLEVSSALLEKFSDDEWAKLRDQVLLRQIYWQERCATAIGYLENERGVDILKDLIDSDHVSIAAIAASELDNMQISLPKSYRTRLLKLLKTLEGRGDNRSDDVQRIIDRLQ